MAPGCKGGWHAGGGGSVGGVGGGAEGVDEFGGFGGAGGGIVAGAKLVEFGAQAFDFLLEFVDTGVLAVDLLEKCPPAGDGLGDVGHRFAIARSRVETTHVALLGIESHVVGRPQSVATVVSSMPARRAPSIFLSSDRPGGGRIRES